MPLLELKIESDPERRREVYEEVLRLSSPTRSYYFMIGLSGIIATYGLLANSVAAVIGAMLVAPMLWPIFGMAMSLTTGDRKLLRTSLTSLLMGVAVVVGLSFLVGLLPWRPAFGSEVWLRTQPTLYELVIALASGLAGAYALVNPRMSPALPGVAVATALVPPLATMGLGLATARWEVAGGAALLFVANLLAIELATALIFVLFGMIGEVTAEIESMLGLLKRFAISLVILAVVATYMTYTLVRVVGDSRIQQQSEEVIAQELSLVWGAELGSVQQVREPDALKLTATVYAPRKLTSEQIAATERKLESALGRQVHLYVRSIISEYADANGPVTGEPGDGVSPGD
jgi:uncharacterized hydrophobic protein (TIGR00271 family)